MTTVWDQKPQGTKTLEGLKDYARLIGCRIGDDGKIVCTTQEQWDMIGEWAADEFTQQVLQ